MTYVTLMMEILILLLLVVLLSSSDLRNYNLYSLFGFLLARGFAFDDVGDVENKEIIGLNYDYNWGFG